MAVKAAVLQSQSRSLLLLQCLMGREGEKAVEGEQVAVVSQ